MRRGESSDRASMWRLDGHLMSANGHTNGDTECFWPITASSLTVPIRAYAAACLSGANLHAWGQLTRSSTRVQLLVAPYRSCVLGVTWYLALTASGVMHNRVDATYCEFGFQITEQKPPRSLPSLQCCIHVAKREATHK